MAEKPRATLADYLVIAVSPALIMGLVGSLVFFLLEVFYRGEYGSNLRWILFFYVFGAVLASRMTVSGEAEGRGFMYSILLGVLTWIGSLRFADYPAGSSAAPYAGLINLFLVVLIAWCAAKLVRDCTHIDDSMDVDAQGLLEASGLEDQEQGQAAPGRILKGGKKKSWLARWLAYREAKQKKRTPGVWVVYFSLAALPLFGMGQAFIPPQETERRTYTFHLLVIYLACGLGLLLTTCFLGLRRYLRQRKLTMPPAMAGAWLLVGGLLILALLGTATLIPRPEMGYSALTQVDPSEDDDRKASDNAVVKDSRGQDGKNPQGKPDKDGQPGNQRDKDRPGQDRDRGQGDKDGQKDRGGDKEKKDAQGGGKDQKDKEDKDRDAKGEAKSRDPGRVPPMPQLTTWLQNLGPWVKWIVFGLLALIVLFWLIRNGLRYLANFTEWARKLLEWWARFWAGLFAGATDPSESEESSHASEPRPSKSYPDPFLTGACESMDERELVRYTFAALQAWGGKQAIERRPDETPMEYAARLAADRPEMADWIRKLTSLYARAVYGYGPLPGAAEDFLREFWLALAEAGLPADSSAS